MGLKTKDVAQYAGVAIPTQSNYENGKRYPDAQYLFKIAELGFDMNFVITGERKINNVSAKENMLLELFRKAPESVQNHILSGLLTEQKMNSGVVVGDNNSCNVAGGDQVINESYPCKSCGVAFLSKVDHQFFPYCSSCTWNSRQKRKNFFSSIAIILAAISTAFYLQNTDIFINEIALLSYHYTGISGQKLRLAPTFLPIPVVFLVFAMLSQLLAYLLNKKHYPYH